MLWIFTLIWRSYWWLTIVPASLVFLNFTPWSGWVVFDELDILLLGTIAVGYTRLAGSSRQDTHIGLSAKPRVVSLVLGGLLLLSMSRGIADTEGFSFDWFAGYTHALNSLRVGKSEGYALLCLPLLHQEMLKGAALAFRRIAIGMVTGLSVVVLAVLWERLAFGTLLDYSTPYRNVALFWEMHVGGGAIDAYLAIATPFAVWAVVSARRPLTWFGAAVLGLLTAYTVLTTFSRGLYLSVVLSLLVLGILHTWKRLKQATDENPNPPSIPDWRTKANIILWLMLGFEIVRVLGVGTFMLERMARSPDDFQSRVTHWQRGLALLDGPTDWWLGKGLGRLPTHYANQGPLGEFSGEAQSASELDLHGNINRFMTVFGPKTKKRLGGQFSLTQRVPSPQNEPYLVRMYIRAPAATDLQLEWCQRHLLYDGGCQTALLHIDASPAWRPLVQPLVGSIPPALWYAPRLAVFTVSVVNAGGRADIDNIQLEGPNEDQLLTNGDYSEGSAHWVGSAQSYYLPWHIDNLFLELLIERGLFGLGTFLMVVGFALSRCTSNFLNSKESFGCVMASLIGVLSIALTGSVMDVPRVMFLFYLMVFAGALLPAHVSLNIATTRSPKSSSK